MFVESTLDRIRSLQIPAFAKTEVQGIGGLFYELAIGEGFTSVRYRWWQEPPRGWRELHAIAEGIVEYVDSRADRGHTIQRENAADT